MKKHVAAVRLVDRDEATEAVELPEELRLSLGAIASVAREGLLAMCTTVGLAVMGEMMTAEMTAKVGGPKHAKLAQRQGNWHGSAPGSAVLGGRRVPVERPRGRTVTGDEIELATYAAFSNDDLLSQVVMDGCSPRWRPAGTLGRTNRSATTSTRRAGRRHVRR